MTVLLSSSMLVHMKAVLLVGMGGCLGAICRYLISIGMSRLVAAPMLPYGTLVANVLGCLAAGMLFGVLNRDSQAGLFLIVGFLGSLTTFSTFSTEALDLLKTRSFFMSAGYAALTVFICLAAAGLGTVIMRNVKGA